MMRPGMGPPLPDRDSDRTPGEIGEPSASERTDEALMEQFCEGSAAAFDALYARHRVGLHGFFRKMTGSQAAADDLLQITFLHLVKARERYARGERFKPWLYAIARNAARDYLRLAHHRESGGQEAEAPLAQAEAPEPPEAPDASEVAALKSALSELPPQYREAVVMHHLEGLSFSEIAAAVGSTTGAVKVRAHRGYERLRAALAKLRGAR